MCVMSLPASPVLSSPWALKGFILLLSVYANFRTSLCMTRLVSLHGTHLRNWWETQILGTLPSRSSEGDTWLFNRPRSVLSWAVREKHGPNSSIVFLFCFFVFIHLAHGGCQPVRPLRHLCLTFSSPVRSGEPCPSGSLLHECCRHPEQS